MAMRTVIPHHDPSRIRGVWGLLVAVLIRGSWIGH